MGKKIKKITLFVGAVLAFFLKADFALALELQYPTVFGMAINSTSNLENYVKYFFNIGVALALFIAVLSIAFGGVSYLVAIYRGKFKDEGKERMKSGILGLLIITCAYIIIYTINPNLVVLRLGNLTPIPKTDISGNIINPSAKIITYNEIPIGTLTENLLTRTAICYDFDAEGNPISSDDYSDSNYFMPTNLNHDRVDCLAKLVEGAQKKAALINELSKAINGLMDQCSCSGGSCQIPCNDLPMDSRCGSVPLCNGECDQCTDQSGYTGGDACPDGIKSQIDNGPVLVSLSGECDECQDDSSCFSGFACNTDSGLCKKEYNGLAEFKCSSSNCYIDPASVEESIEINNEQFMAINKNEWNQLTLLEQLSYFKEKMGTIKSQIEADVNKLNQAKNLLMTQNCFLSDLPPVSLLKEVEGTETEKYAILKNKPFLDPETNTPVDATRYCKGFNYANSDCFNKCNNACPDTSDAAILCFTQCPVCDPYDYDCLEDQRECTEDCYFSRPCTFGDDSYQNQDFEECVSLCQDSCLNTCTKKYATCSDQFNKCKNACQNNSECILTSDDSDPLKDNLGNCILDSMATQNLQWCAEDTTDPGNSKYCIDNSYSCEYGSYQYAGYIECLKNENEIQYSASYLYKNPDQQKCTSPYDLESNNKNCIDIYPKTSKCPPSSYCPYCPCENIDQNVQVYIPKASAIDGGNTCSNPNTGYNEGCASNLDCPDPSCLLVKGTASENCPNIGTCNDSGNCDYNIEEYQMVAPECMEYSYNDDPLIFYCEANIFNSPKNDPTEDGSRQTPIGNSRYCRPLGEIVVGQTVDGAIDWAVELTVSVQVIQSKISTMIDQGIKLGSPPDVVQGYCTCSAKFEDGKPVCGTDCEYIPPETELDDDGNPVLKPNTNICALAPLVYRGVLTGKACAQMQNYITIFTDTYNQFNASATLFYIYQMKEPRSDTLKMLTYSRQKTDACSTVNLNYIDSSSGPEKVLLGCKTVRNEIIPPIKTDSFAYNGQDYPGYCYGYELGQIQTPQKLLTDNWFCCEVQQEGSSPTAPER